MTNAQWFADQTAAEKAREVQAKQASREELRKIGTAARARRQRMPLWVSVYCQCLIEDGEVRG